MLIEVKYFNFLTEAELRRMAASVLEHREEQQWHELTLGIESFPDCPVCRLPPAPQRHGFQLNCEVPHRAEYGRGGTYGHTILGPELKTWEFTCICNTRLKYEDDRSGEVILVKHNMAAPPF